MYMCECMHISQTKRPTIQMNICCEMHDLNYPLKDEPGGEKATNIFASSQKNVCSFILSLL